MFPLTFALAALLLLALQASTPMHGLRLRPRGAARSPGVIARMGLTFWENLALVDRSRDEALTDPLTGLWATAAGSC